MPELPVRQAIGIHHPVLSGAFPSKETRRVKDTTGVDAITRRNRPGRDPESA